MPFECRKDGMVWGPHHACVTLNAGDEVPSPIRPNLLNQGRVAEVKEVSGKKWRDQPVEAQKAWAESEGLTYLENIHTGERTAVFRHPTEVVYAEEPKAEAGALALPAPLEVAGAGSPSKDEVPAPPMPKKRGRLKKRRG